MNKSSLDDLLARYVAGQVTEQEKIKVEAWLDVKKTDKGGDLVLDKADEERLFQKITSRISSIEDIKTFRPLNKNVGSRLPPTWWLRMAASLLILLLASYTLWLTVFKKEGQDVTTHASSEKVILGDGSIVWLQRQSHLTYVNNDGIRHATLSGEALFEVAKDAARPFIIQCGEVQIKVVGTSFHLKTMGEGVELKVLTGRVNVSSPANLSGVDVEPREMALYHTGEDLKKIQMDKQEIEAIVAETEYDMKFQNTAMDQVVNRIEKKFEIRVTIQDARLAKCRITADFTDHSLESTFSMLSELLEITYTIDDGTVSVTGHGCN